MIDEKQECRNKRRGFCVREGVPKGVAGTSSLHCFVIVDEADISGIGVTRTYKVGVAFWPLCDLLVFTTIIFYYVGQDFAEDRAYRFLYFP